MDGEKKNQPDVYTPIYEGTINDEHKKGHKIKLYTCSVCGNQINRFNSSKVCRFCKQRLSWEGV